MLGTKTCIESEFWALTKSSKGSVALYFHRLSSMPGGAPRMICALADALVQRGLKVHMISWDPPNAQSFYPFDSAIEWSRLGFSSGIFDKIRRSRDLARVLRENRVRVLIGFVMSSDKTVYAAAKLARVRLIAAERNAPTMYHLRYGRTQRWLSFALLHLADRVTIQMSEFAAGYPASLRSRMETIPNPVRKAERRAEPSRPNRSGRFILLSVGRFDGVKKGLDCLVCAFARVAAKHPNWDLRLIGGGPLEGVLRRLVVERGVAKRVFLDGVTSNVFPAYSEAHLFAIPSKWEGFPNALAEALAHGLPAIGFRNAAGVAQLITDGETGWLAEGISDEAELARVLDIAMTDDNERARRGFQAAQSVAIYEPEAQFDRWAKMIKPLVAEAAR